jgi:hypothetical protein
MVLWVMIVAGRPTNQQWFVIPYLMYHISVPLAIAGKYYIVIRPDLDLGGPWLRRRWPL